MFTYWDEKEQIVGQTRGLATSSATTGTPVAIAAVMSCAATTSTLHAI